MNKTKNFAAYESPTTEFLALELESAVLSGSVLDNTDSPASHNGFTAGETNVLDFLG